MYTCYVLTKPTYQFIINTKFFDMIIMIPNKSMAFPMAFMVFPRGFPWLFPLTSPPVPPPRALRAAHPPVAAPSSGGRAGGPRSTPPEELVLPNKTMGKIREKYGKNMENITV